MNGTLHVSDVTRSDGGVYQCFVANGVGRNETTVLVTVNGGEDEDEGEGEEEEEDFFPTSSSAAVGPPDFHDLKKTPPSRPNVTQV